MVNHFNRAVVPLWTVRVNRGWTTIYKLSIHLSKQTVISQWHSKFICLYQLGNITSKHHFEHGFKIKRRRLSLSPTYVSNKCFQLMSPNKTIEKKLTFIFQIFQGHHVPGFLINIWRSIGCFLGSYIRNVFLPAPTYTVRKKSFSTYTLSHYPSFNSISFTLVQN